MADHPFAALLRAGAEALDDPTLDRAFADLAEFECSFEVTDFHLYVHDEQEGWRATRTFALS